MALVRLGREWSHLMEKYSADHQHPVNQACHAVGIPLIAGSIPLAATVIGLPLAVPMFSVGWTFQLVGHLFEGKKPAFLTDRRHHIVGLLWWAKKRGLAIETTEAERV